MGIISNISLQKQIEDFSEVKVFEEINALTREDRFFLIGVCSESDKIQRYYLDVFLSQNNPSSIETYRIIHQCLNESYSTFQKCDETFKNSNLQQKIEICRKRMESLISGRL
ncbi:MAG: hypothetical protein K1060chlam5_00326 [Candidatus Anoxychlamydiales bacterium]|nr:hypothetical protein [Candidatus Anoxychlamydiales bacterium]